MKDYGRILNKITESVWLITPTALATIVEIVDKRISGDSLTDEEIATRLSAVEDRNTDGTPQANSGVGVLSLYGPIFGKANLMTKMSGATDLETFSKDFTAMVENDLIHTIVLDVDSPGGTSDLVAETGELIKAATDVKPVYAIADNMMASAALWLGSQATKLYGTSSGSVGSIGAYTVHQDQSGADAQRGNRYTYTFAGPYKTEGNPHEPLSPEGAAYRQEVINELYNEFVDAVALGRNVSTDKVINDFGGGRMLTSKKALDVDLIDGITTLDKLVADSSAKPTKTTVMMPDGSMATAFWRGNHLEVAEWEHSEPGTGSPPQPALPTETDSAIASGSRRDPLPLPPDDPNAPKASHQEVVNWYLNMNSEGGNALTAEQLASLYQLHGIDPATDEDGSKLIAALNSSKTELDIFKNKGSAPTEQEKAFAETYPDVHKEHMELLSERRNANAEKFVDSVKHIMKPGSDAGSFTATGASLSTLAMETLTDAHCKFASGEGTLEDFENCITTITRGGTVLLGDKGSSRVNEVGVIDITTPDGVRNARELFAAKVMEIQNEGEGMPYMDALQEAGKRYPDLAAAYKIAIPA